MERRIQECPGQVAVMVSPIRALGPAGLTLLGRRFSGIDPLHD
jgi:hypothetical protein